MFGLGGWEIAILGLAALVFFGPQKLPQLMKQAGKVMREVRKASFEFQSSLEREMEDDPYRRAHRREKKKREKAAKLGLPPEALDGPKDGAAEPAAVPAPGPTGAEAGPAPSANGAAAPPEPAGEPAVAAEAAGQDKPKSGTA